MEGDKWKVIGLEFRARTVCRMMGSILGFDDGGKAAPSVVDAGLSDSSLLQIPSLARGNTWKRHGSSRQRSIPAKLYPAQKSWKILGTI